MQTANIEMRPRNSANPIINRTTSNPNFVVSDVTADTYDYTIVSDTYDTVTGVVVVDAHKSVAVDLKITVVEPIITWFGKTRTRDIPFEIETIYDETKLPSEGSTVSGETGSEYQTYEQKYVDGVATSDERNVSGWTVTKVAKTQVVIVGTKAGEVVNLLNDSNTFSAGSNNLLTDGVHDPEKIFKISETMQILKWESDGRIRWFSGMVEWLKPYTIEFEIRKISGTFNDIGGYLSGSWHDYDKTIFKDGVEIAGDWEVGVPLSDTSTWQTYKIHITMGESVGLQDEFTIEPNVSDGTTCTYEIRNIGLYNGLI